MGLTEKFKRRGFLIEKDYSYSKDSLVGEKAYKEYEKDTLKIIVNDIEMDANKDSINYMSSVIALANSEYIEAFAKGGDDVDKDKLYDDVFGQLVPWKKSDNTKEYVTINFIKTALREALLKTASLIGIDK